MVREPGTGCCELIFGVTDLESLRESSAACCPSHRVCVYLGNSIAIQGCVCRLKYFWYAELPVLDEKKGGKEVFLCANARD
jgi:hypothetical protein